MYLPLFRSAVTLLNGLARDRPVEEKPGQRPGPVEENPLGGVRWS
jgi:hypothetical protein